VIDSSRDLTRIAFDTIKNQILITDLKDKSIKKVTLNGQEIFSESNGNINFQSPYSICINSLNEICVYDWHLNSLFLFDENSEQVSELNLNNYFKNGKKLVNFMTFDPQNPSFLYFTNTSENKVTLVDLKHKKFLDEKHLDSPYDIKLDNKNIYLTSSTSYSYDSVIKRIGKIVTGSNCIFILNKRNFQPVRTIKHPNWTKPKGLHVDCNGFIWTTAFKNDDVDVLNLFILNQNGEIINSIRLNFKVFSDFFLIEHKIFFCAGNSLRLIKFD
jgi:hypothetical protein